MDKMCFQQIKLIQSAEYSILWAINALISQAESISKSNQYSGQSMPWFKTHVYLTESIRSGQTMTGMEKSILPLWANMNKKVSGNNWKTCAAQIKYVKQTMLIQVKECCGNQSAKQRRSKVLHTKGPPQAQNTIRGEASFSNHPIGTSPNELVHFTPFQDYHKHSKMKRVIN
jgi:hypothetical protein